MELEGKHILILAGEGFDDRELFYPYYRFKEAGATVVVAGEIEGREITGKRGITIRADKSFDDVKVADFDALIIPGGRGPENLRKNPKAIELVKEAAAHSKPIAAICHGPQLLVTADLLRGKRVASYPAVRPEVLEAGAEYLDEEVVVDGNLITSRRPDDLPAFSRAVIEMLSRAPAEEPELLAVTRDA